MKTSPDYQLPSPQMAPYEVGVIPDDAPIVSVDLGLGKKYRDVSFDYDAFRREAERLGFPTENMGELNIRISKSRGKYGEYDGSNKSIDVRAYRSTNRTLSHELQHASDDARGILVHDMRYKIGRVSRLPVGLIPASLANSVSMPLAEVTGHNTLERINFGTAILIGAISVSHIYGYWGHPTERRARMAEKASKESMIQLVKR